MTPTQLQSDEDRLSPQGLEELLRLLVAGQSRRISSAIVDGRKVWIKRMAAESRPLFKTLHGLVSPLLPWPILRSSKLATPDAMAEREVRKTAAFAAAGFPAVHVLFRQGSNLALSNASPIVQDELNRLKATDPETHDDLLVACAAALGSAHRAGLCHGRPHPRDMIVEGARIGFLDFEEAPEEVMARDDAQARDLWLMFLQICGQSVREDTNQRALDAYRAEAPATVLSRLSTMRNMWRALLPVLRAMQPIGLGADGRRLLKASAFLHAALAQASAQITDHTLPGARAGRKPKATQ